MIPLPLCLTRDDLYHPVSQAYPAITSPSFPCRSGSLIQINCRPESSLTEKSCFRSRAKGVLCKSHQRYVTIDALPDDVLLEIFDYYMAEAVFEDAWYALVHVSQDWRCLVFDSPRRLNLRLLCSGTTPVREMLTVWPPLPIIIRRYSAWNEDNIIAALEHHDRVCGIHLEDIPSSLLEKFLTAMQDPLPALESLDIGTPDDMPPVVSDSFLGGSAPHLRHLWLTGIPFPFPVLGKLLLSATHLVELSLHKIPHSGYFSPEAMVTHLSALKRLEVLEIEFESPRSRPSQENRRPPPLARTLLPALRRLLFTGVSEYLEDLMARIDSPPLHHLNIRFFHQLIFDTPQLSQSITRNFCIQEDEADNEAHVTFSESHVSLWLSGLFADGLELEISCRQSDWQLSALAQVCSSAFPQGFIPTVELLRITEDGYSQPRWQDDIENGQWLELLYPFIGVKILFLSQKFAPRITLALQELVGERANEVLPALQSIYLEGLHPSGIVSQEIGHFVNARRLSGHPIGVIPWTRQDTRSNIDGRLG